MHSAQSIIPAPGIRAPVKAGDLAVIVGAGASGVAAARLLHALGARLRLLDSNSDHVSDEVRHMAGHMGMDIVCGPHEPEHFAGAALVVTSPGVPVSKLGPIVERAGNPPLIGEMELALRYVKEPVLAVTGTSGKTTTVSLAAAMLEAAGKKVFLGGNIGTPLSDYVLWSALTGGAADVLVLEMSSFQLQGVSSLHPKVAMILNLSANHLDHHKDMDEYADAKFSIFALQDAGDTALLPPELADEYARRGYRAPLTVFAPAGRFTRIQLAGGHNAANAEAAYQAVRVFGVGEAEAAQALAEFAPLRHRLEKAGTLGGVLYVNDSKSTTVDALRAALTSFDAPLLLLAGGKFKGGDLASLCGLIKERVKAVGLFGASREYFEEAWQGLAPISWDAALPEALRRMRGLASAGDVVLLSPATSSYDLYNNYQERGDHFCRLVKEMAAQEIAADPTDRERVMQ